MEGATCKKQDALKFGEDLFADLITSHSIFDDLPRPVRKKKSCYDPVIGKWVMSIWFDVDNVLKTKLRSDFPRFTQSRSIFENYLKCIADNVSFNTKNVHHQVIGISVGLFEVISFVYKRGMPNFIIYAASFWKFMFDCLKSNEFHQPCGWCALKVTAETEIEDYFNNRSKVQVEYWVYCLKPLEMSRSVFVKHTCIDIVKDSIQQKPNHCEQSSSNKDCEEEFSTDNSAECKESGMNIGGESTENSFKENGGEQESEFNKMKNKGDSAVSITTASCIDKLLKEIHIRDVDRLLSEMKICDEIVKESEKGMSGDCAQAAVEARSTCEETEKESGDKPAGKDYLLSSTRDVCDDVNKLNLARNIYDKLNQLNLKRNVCDSDVHETIDESPTGGEKKLVEHVVTHEAMIETLDVKAMEPNETQCCDRTEENSRSVEARSTIGVIAKETTEASLGCQQQSSGNVSNEVMETSSGEKIEGCCTSANFKNNLYLEVVQYEADEKHDHPEPSSTKDDEDHGVVESLGDDKLPQDEQLVEIPSPAKSCPDEIRNEGSKSEEDAKESASEKHLNRDQLPQNVTEAHSTKDVKMSSEEKRKETTAMKHKPPITDQKFPTAPGQNVKHTIKTSTPKVAKCTSAEPSPAFSRLFPQPGISKFEIKSYNKVQNPRRLSLPKNLSEVSVKPRTIGKAKLATKNGESGANKNEDKRLKPSPIRTPVSPRPPIKSQQGASSSCSTSTSSKSASDGAFAKKSASKNGDFNLKHSGKTKLATKNVESGANKNEDKLLKPAPIRTPVSPRLPIKRQQGAASSCASSTSTSDGAFAKNSASKNGNVNLKQSEKSTSSTKSRKPAAENSGKRNPIKTTASDGKESKVEKPRWR